MSFYRTGTISIIQRTVTGSGTAFLANVKPGDTLVINGVVGVVEAVLSNTSILLADDWSGAGVVNSSDFAFVRTGLEWSRVRELNATLSTLIERLDSGTPFRPQAWISNVSELISFSARDPGFIVGRVDTDPFQIAVKMGAGATWSQWAGLRGPPGSPGTPGTIGPIGLPSTVPGPIGLTPWAPPAPWASGQSYTVGPPASVVTRDGSVYVCAVTHTSTGTFQAGNWILVASRGDTGLQGPRGNAMLFGAVDPLASNGVDGDFWINTVTYRLFGPKSGGVWGAGFSLAQLPGVLSTATTSSVLSLAYGVANHALVTLNHSIATLQLTGWPPSGALARMTIEIVQGAGGGRSIQWPTGWRWANGLAPTVTAAAGARDIYAITTTDGGATLYAHVVGQDFKTGA